MKKIVILLFVVALCHCCSSRKTNSVLSHKSKNEKQSKRELVDSITNNTIPTKIDFNFSETLKDSLIVSDEKIVVISEMFNIKDTIVEFSSNNRCYDIGIKISCYRNTKFVFSRIIKKNDFKHFFIKNKYYNLKDLILSGSSIKRYIKDPFRLYLMISICRPIIDDCFDFILQFDVAGNYTMQGYDPENG